MTIGFNAKTDFSGVAEANRRLQKQNQDNLKSAIQGVGGMIVEGRIMKKHAADPYGYDAMQERATAHSTMNPDRAERARKLVVDEDQRRARLVTEANEATRLGQAKERIRLSAVDSARANQNTLADNIRLDKELDARTKAAEVAEKKANVKEARALKKEKRAENTVEINAEAVKVKADNKIISQYQSTLNAILKGNMGDAAGAAAEMEANHKGLKDRYERAVQRAEALETPLSAGEGGANSNSLFNVAEDFLAPSANAGIRGSRSTGK